MPDCLVLNLGFVEYPVAESLQKDLHRRVAAGDLPTLLLLLQHPHVYTLGRRGSENDILAPADTLEELNAKVYATDRGGEVTYHGPGQLVGYPILDLRSAGLGPLAYVRALERIIISTLAEFNIHATTVDRPTGVWVGDAKIAAIGVRVSRGVTMHGFALNIEPDLAYFDHIVPCGMPDARVTSIAEEGAPSEISGVSDVLTTHFATTFDYSPIPTTLEAITEECLAVTSSAQGTV